jgi:hypothetical protein
MQKNALVNSKIYNTSNYVPYLQKICTKTRALFEGTNYIYMRWVHACYCCLSQQLPYLSRFCNIYEIVRSAS